MMDSVKSIDLHLIIIEILGFIYGFNQPDIFIQQIIHLIIDSESLHKDSDNLCNFNAQDKKYTDNPEGRTSIHIFQKCMSA